MPEVAVIVPARNAGDTIGRTLEAIAQLAFDDPYEVIVVDDQSTDATAEIAESSGARVIRLPKQRGPGAARNAGSTATDATILAFTDADCAPSRSWLAAGTAAIAAGADLVTGPIRPMPEAPLGTFDRTLNVEGPSPLFESANVLVRRELLDKVEGFSRPGLVQLDVEAGHFGEDAVFGWRAMRAGARRRHVPEAIVYHAVFPRGPAGYLRERWRLRLFPALVAEIPELRSAFPARVFLSARTMRFDLALVATLVAATSRRPAPLLATLPYLLGDIRSTAGSDYPQAIARGAVLSLGDAIGAAALLYGSVRARSIVA